MSRTCWLIVPLLLAASVVRADNVSEPERTTRARAEQAPAENGAERAADAAPEQAQANENAAPATDRAAEEQAPSQDGAGSPTDGTAKEQTPSRDGSESPTDDTEAQVPKQEGPKEIEGMSILGNREAPKSLVIVPWKSSEIGASVGISTLLDDSRQPVDREEFMRALSFYEIRSEDTP